MSGIPDPPAGAIDPGNADPEAFAEPLSADELADVLGLVDDPTDPTIVAGLAGTLYDPEYDGPGDPGPVGELDDQEVNTDGE